MSDESPDIGINVKYENISAWEESNIINPKIYLDFTSEAIPTETFEETDTLSFYDIGRFYEPLLDSVAAFAFNSSYDKSLLFYPGSKVGFIGGFSLISKGFYCKALLTPPMPTLGQASIWETSLGFIDFSYAENDPYPEGYVGEGIWAVFNNTSETLEIRQLDAAQNEEVLESIKIPIQNTGGNPVEIGFQWDGYKSFKAYYGSYSVIARSDIANSFSSGTFYPIATIEAVEGDINGGIDSLEVGCSVGFNNLNPSVVERGLTLANVSSSDYFSGFTATESAGFSDSLKYLNLNPVFTLDNCPVEYCSPAGDVQEGNVRIGVLGDEAKFEEPICEYLRSEQGVYDYVSNGDKIRFVESSLGDKYLILRNLDTGQFNFAEIIDNEIEWVAFSFWEGMIDFDWFNDRVWIYGQDSGSSIISFSSEFSPDVNIVNPSLCNSIAYHEDSNSFYASYPTDNSIIQYDADDGSVLSTLYVTSFEITKLISCGDYIGIIDRESDAVDVGSDSSRIRFLNPDTNTIVKSFPATDPNDAIYDIENNCVYFFVGEGSGATPTPENDALLIFKLPLNTLSYATPTLSFQWVVSVTGAERNISDLFVYNDQIYIISNGALYIRSTSNGSLVSTEDFEQEVLSLTHEITGGATPSSIVWTIGVDTSATPEADGNMLFQKNCAFGNKLGLKNILVTIADSATPYFPGLIGSETFDPSQIPEAIDECVVDDKIPSIIVFIENWDNVSSNKQSINEIIDYIHASFDATKIPVFLTILPTPDLDYDADLTEEQALLYWRIYQRHTRRVLDLGILNGVQDYEYISFCTAISDASVLEMIENESLESERWLEGTWDLPILVASVALIEEEPPVDYTAAGLAILSGPTFEWFSNKNVSKIIISFLIDTSGGETFDDEADFYQAAYDLAITSGSTGATPSVEPQVIAIVMNEASGEISGAFLNQVKLSLGYSTSLTATEGQQSKVLYSKAEDFVSHTSNLILDNQILELIFGDKNTYENILNNSGTPVDDYIQLFNEVQQNLSGSYRLYGPNIDISSRDEGYDQSYNTVLMDSRYVGYLEDFINALNSATPTFRPSGLAFSGDFSAEEWPNVISYIKDTLSFSGEIVVSNIDPNPSYDSNILYKQKSQSIINELGPIDKLFLTDNYIFTGSFDDSIAEWAFVGSLNVVSEGKNVILKIISYTEPILLDGYIEISSEGAATPYSYSSDLPIPGSSIELGDLDPGTYSLVIFGTVGSEGEASMSLGFEFDNFNELFLNSSKYFSLN